MLRQIYRKLAPGGRFVIDIYNRDYFERHQGTRHQEIQGVAVESNGYMQENRWHTVLKYRTQSGESGGDHMEWQMFSPAGFSALAAQLSFDTKLACTWSDEHRAPSPEIARMQIVLEKR